jgi:hypothetical protein
MHLALRSDALVIRKLKKLCNPGPEPVACGLEQRASGNPYCGHYAECSFTISTIKALKSRMFKYASVQYILPQDEYSQPAWTFSTPLLHAK